MLKIGRGPVPLHDELLSFTDSTEKAHGIHMISLDSDSAKNAEEGNTFWIPRHEGQNSLVLQNAVLFMATQSTKFKKSVYILQFLLQQ